jgi:hypothetical protein
MAKTFFEKIARTQESSTACIRLSSGKGGIGGSWNLFYPDAI